MHYYYLYIKSMILYTMSRIIYYTSYFVSWSVTSQLDCKIQYNQEDISYNIYYIWIRSQKCTYFFLVTKAKQKQTRSTRALTPMFNVYVCIWIVSRKGHFSWGSWGQKWLYWVSYLVMGQIFNINCWMTHYVFFTGMINKSPRNMIKLSIYLNRNQWLFTFSNIRVYILFLSLLCFSGKNLQPDGFIIYLWHQNPQHSLFLLTFSSL